MHDPIKVNYGGLDTASQDLARSAQAIQARLEQLEAELRNRVAPNWDGDAHSAFLRAKAQWDQGMLELRELLARISVSVDHASTEYRATDARGRRRFET